MSNNYFKEIHIKNTKLILKKGDITKEKVDVIVNAANTGLRGGGGVDGAIHRAGGPKIMEECRKIIAKIGHLPTGKVVATTAGNLDAKWVFHTPGPIYRGGNSGEEKLLESCYLESLKLALEKKAKTIAFPSISTGIYGYPVKDASKIALKSVINFIEKNDLLKEVRFILFDDHTFNTYLNTLTDILKDQT